MQLIAGEDRRLLRGPLGTLVAGQCAGQAADGLAQITFAQIVVFEAGRGATPTRIAALLAVTLLPFSLVGPFAGVLIDRWPRRRVLVLLSLLRAALTLAAVATVALRWQAGAFVGVLLLLSASRFVLAAKGAVLPQTVRPDQLVSANALSSVAGMAAAFTGAVGGSAFVGWSAGAGFVCASLLYLGAGAVFARLPDLGSGEGRDVLGRLRTVLGDLREGLRAIGRPEIGQPLSAVWLHRLLLGAGFVLLVLVADSRFHLRVSGYGLALAVTGVAAFAGSVAAPACARRWRPVALLPVTFLPPAVAAYAAGTAPNLVVLVAALGVTALSFQLLKVLVDALVGGASPDAVRGRVFSVYDVLYNVAFVLAGLLMVPLWDPTRVPALLWWLAAAFLLAWALYARVLRVWPFAAPRRPGAAPSGRWRSRAAALGCGALPVLAFPAVGWWWFAWVCLVPVLLLVRAAPTPREAAVRGWWAGAGYVAATEYWLAPSAGPALALMAFGLGALWLPWGWAVRRLLGGHPRPRTLLAATLVLPAGWVAVEAVRSWQSLGGPWALLGASQWNRPVLLASAALGGVWLTGLLVVMVNVAVAAAVVSTGRGARAGLAAVAVLALAVGPAWAALRPALPADGAVRVGVVQPGVMTGAAARFAQQVRLSEALAGRHPDLVGWGESSIGDDLRTHPALTRRLVALTRRTGADLLANVDARPAGGRVFKTAVLVTPHGVAGRYEKTRLVPFGEYIPFRPLLGWIADFTKAAPQNLGRGPGLVVLHTGRLHSGGIAFGPLICFESTFPDMARREVALGAQLIVFQTADSTFQGSWEQPQQASLSAVRAVETGRPVLQVALTGTTAAFDATGHRLLWITPGRRAGAVRTLPLAGGRTPYDVAGDWVLAVAAAVLAAALAGTALGRNRVRTSR
ncbi:MAG: apolipoprotein N-acyltransferase [Nocardioidaceae bacterium]